MALAKNTAGALMELNDTRAVDFVIPHMGRTELLLATLESISQQSVGECIDRIVVVTKNTEPLPPIPDSRVQVLYRPEAGTISEQRNIGAAGGTAAVIAFLDADIGLADDWLAQCLALLYNRPGTALVSAMQALPDNPTPVERLRVTLSNATTDTPVQFLPGRNLLLKRADHAQVGGFPEHLQTCEDYYYTEQVSQLGELYYTSATYYYHLGEDKTLAQTFQKEIWRSEYNLKSLSGRSVPLREWPSILLPFWVAMFSVLSALAVAFPGVGLASLGLALVPAGLYGLRLLRLKPPTVQWWYPFVFYAVYFWARALGTVTGIRHLLKGHN